MILASNRSWVIGIVVLLISLYFFDRRNWREKPLEDFHNMVMNDSDYAGWNIGLTQLRKRGADITPYIELSINRLKNPDRIVREAAKQTIVKNYPEMRPKLKGIYCVQELDNSCDLAENLLAKHRIVPTAEVVE